MARKEKVTKVIDGDTFETASRKNPVRLAKRGCAGEGTTRSCQGNPGPSKPDSR